VPIDKKEAFSIAQSQWNKIANSPGLIGQFGGWDTLEKKSACIVSLWQDQKCYDHFMTNIHDEIASKNNQSSTYDELEICFFDTLYPMPGKFPDLKSAISDGVYLRVADCYVKEAQALHFENIQKTIWIPAMKQSEGMLGGSFNLQNNGAKRYLVTTLWDNEKDHSLYTKEKVPELRKKANVADDLEKIVGRLIKLEPSWLVLGKGT